MKNGFYAGWASRNITPRGRKVALSGQFYERITEEIESELFITAFTLANSETSFTWVSCDLLSVSSKLCWDIRQLVKKSCGEINTENIFLSAIHTHTAPSILHTEVTKNDNSKSDVLSAQEYHDFVAHKIAEAVVESNSSKKPGFSVQTGVSPIRTGCCRRGIVEGNKAIMYIDVKRPDFLKMEAQDSGPLNLMYLKDNNDELKGVIPCIPCTAQVLEHKFFVSSDYVGKTRSLLKKEFGDHFLFLPLIAAAGDLSPRDLLNKDYGFGDMYDIDGATNMGKRVYEAILAQANSPVDIIQNPKDLKVASKTVDLPGWVPSPEEYKWALSMKDSDKIRYDIKDYVQKNVEPYDGTPLELNKIINAIITRFENTNSYKTAQAEIAAVRIGNTAWISNPFELFHGLASRITAASKAKSVWTVQLANGSLGYFPTRQAAQAGGYGAYIFCGRADPFKAESVFLKESIGLGDALF